MAGVGSVTWLTYDSGLTQELLHAVGRQDDRVVFAPYAAPRDVRNLVGDARVVRRVLRAGRFDLAVSTGAGIAVAALPLARAMGVRSCFIESATRALRPSLSGSILQRVPGLELFSQHGGYSSRWRYVGSVHDGFERGPDRECHGELSRVVVTLGTSEAYGFRRLVERLVRILPRSADVLWQTGVTDTSGLGIDARRHVPTKELEDAMREADAVVAHAGTGTAMTAFELGVCPVLVPRRSRHGENIDEHQSVTARDLERRGLAICAEADEVSRGHLTAASARSVTRRNRPPRLPI